MSKEELLPLKRKCCVDSSREDVFWWNKFAGKSPMFHIERAGVTYPQSSYCISRSRREDSFDGLYVIEYVVSGKGIVESEGMRTEVKKGDLYIICRKTTHCYYADKIDPFEKKWINVTGEFLNAMIPKTVGDLPFAVYPLGEEAEKIMDKIHSKIRRVTPMDTEEMSVSVMKSLLDLLLLIDRYKREEENSMSTEDKIVEYIEKNICLDINVSTVCEHFFISSSTLYRIVTSKFGMSPKNFITKKKIEAAKRMIAADASSVSTIATSLNFYDTHHFIKTFRSYTGMTPNEYRKTVVF